MADDFLSFVVPAITGGAAGAIITAVATTLRNRRELALKLTEQYLGTMFDKIAKAKLALGDPALLAKNEHWNEVVIVANWFEVVANCYLEQFADAKVLTDMGLIKQGKDFYLAMCDAQKTDGQHLTQAFEPVELAEFNKLRAVATNAIPYL